MCSRIMAEALALLITIVSDSPLPFGHCQTYFSFAKGAPDPATGDAMTPDTLAPNQTAFINLPASLFDSVPEDRPNIGVFFALYDNPSLFPVAEAEVENSTRVVTVLSPVIAATVGPGLFFMDLDPPVSILLRLQELGENDVCMNNTVTH